MKGKIYEMGLWIYSRFDVCKWRLGSYLRDKKGVTTVEYVLLIAVIVIGIVTAATVMFDPLKEFFEGVIDKIKETAGV